jgi:hypothetical protein
VTNDYLLLICSLLDHILHGMWIRFTFKSNAYVLSEVVCIRCVGYMPWRFVCVGPGEAGGFAARLKAENYVSPRKTVNAVLSTVRSCGYVFV